jgi:hypothetical protein
MKVALGGALSLLLVGCASTYTRQTVTASQLKLAATGSVLVAIPHNGAYGDESYPASGSQTAAAVRSSFARFTDNVRLADGGCSEIRCLTADPMTSDYYVVPQILHWEDRATEWSGKKDKIEVKITVYGRDGIPIASQIISGKSKWATFGGDHPQDLLAEPINDYVQSLY